MNAPREVNHDANVVAELWARPYRLWSLLDMIRFVAGQFVRAFYRLELLQTSVFRLPLENDPAYEEKLAEWRADAIDALRAMAAESELAGFRSLMKRCNREHQTLASAAPEPALYLLRSVVADVQSELEDHVFFRLPANRSEWYRETDSSLFGQAVADAFPGSNEEICEAGRCFAFARWTACVFHLMRAVERALHQWMHDLGAPIATPVEQTDIKQILDQADAHLKRMEQQTKSPQRAEDLAYFGATSAHFRAIKDAWRDHVSHSKKTYDESHAREIMNNVKAFMRTLASRPPAAA